MSKLTHKERAFVTFFLGVTKGNATEAARLAGYGTTRASATQLGHRLLRKVKVQQAIALRTEKRESQGIMDANERDEILTRIARGPASPLGLAAIKELNKCSGRHSITHHLDGEITIADALGDVRKDIKTS